MIGSIAFASVWFAAAPPPPMAPSPAYDDRADGYSLRPLHGRWIHFVNQQQGDVVAGLLDEAIVSLDGRRPLRMIDISRSNELRSIRANISSYCTLDGLSQAEECFFVYRRASVPSAHGVGTRENPVADWARAAFDPTISRGAWPKPAYRRIRTGGDSMSARSSPACRRSFP